MVVHAPSRAAPRPVSAPVTSQRASALLAPALALTALLAIALLATALLATACGPVVRPRADTPSPRSPLTPGTRVLLDAHNS